MIQVFTLAHPDNKLKAFGKELSLLAKGAYNLSASNSSHQELFNQLYSLGVRQIIHDGNPNEIQCLDGYLYATNTAAGKDFEEKDLLRIKL